jgi:S-adenosylmethionine synthetase
MGMASCEKNFGFMPRDRYFAHVIGQRLYKAAKANLIPIGLDIKVLVSITKGLNVEQVVIAAPMLPELEDSAKRHITAIVHEVLGERHHTCDEIIINGTGTYVVHSSVGDAGVVGRKLAVDFYGLNCPIGGGTTWGKDGTKADVTLNLAARYFSLKTILEGDRKYQNVFTKLSCCIGRSECLLVQTDEVGNVIKNERINLIPSELIGMFGLRGAVRDDMFYHLCEDGLFSYVDEVAIKDANN